MATLDEQALLFHKLHQGKLTTGSIIPIKTKLDLSLIYTPGVAAVSRTVATDPKLSCDYTWRGRAVAVVSDGSAVLGLGNIGPEAALPVMEGKALLLKELGGVDAVPLVVSTQNPAEIIRFVIQIAPSFAGILLEDISAPRCFQIEEALQEISIPVFHDDQHGTAIVVSAALRNATRVVGKKYTDLKVVIVGAGAAGLATAKMLLGLSCQSDRCEIIPGGARVKDVIIIDKTGALTPGRADQNIYKQAVASLSNITHKSGKLPQVASGADVIIGVSGPGSISPETIRAMAPRAIVFAMANPSPEIMPDVARAAGAVIVATGRSDYPNQINNVLAFPGIFQAVIKYRLTTITPEMKQAASDAIAALVAKPTKDQIVPDPFHPRLAEAVATAMLHKTRPEDKLSRSK